MHFAETELSRTETLNPALEKATLILKELMQEVRDRGVIQSEHFSDLITISIPYARQGKHAFVAFVDIENSNGKTEEFVFRNNLFDVERYKESIKGNPLIESLLPKLVGVIGDWAVLERVHGLELAELEEKIKSDPDFSETYQQKIIQMVEFTSKAGITINDVDFYEGHNCKINNENAEIKFIEQTNLLPSRSDPREIQFKFILEDIESLRIAEPERLKFIFSFLKKYHSKFNLSSLFYRSRMMKPNHPRFQSQYFIENGNDLNDETYKSVLENKEDYEKNSLYIHGQGYSKAFTPELIKAVEEGDEKQFSEVLHANKYIMDIKDEADHRYGKVFV
jgi:hypothetical protein